jgi:hypothetical protein
MDGKNKLPDLEEAYPSLFDDTDRAEKKAEVKENLSALRFKQFALSYNKRFKEVVKEE